MAIFTNLLHIILFWHFLTSIWTVNFNYGIDCPWKNRDSHPLGGKLFISNSTHFLAKWKQLSILGDHKSRPYIKSVPSAKFYALGTAFNKIRVGTAHPTDFSLRLCGIHFFTLCLQKRATTRVAPTAINLCSKSVKISVNPCLINSACAKPVSQNLHTLPNFRVH